MKAKSGAVPGTLNIVSFIMTKKTQSYILHPQSDLRSWEAGLEFYLWYPKMCTVYGIVTKYVNYSGFLHICFSLYEEWGYLS